MSYIQLLTKLHNAQAIHKETVRFPYSKMDDGILEILAGNGYVDSYEKKGKNPKKYFEIRLSFKNGEEGIHGMRFVSTPSRRIYAKSVSLRRVRQGFGMSVVSTSSGIMSGKEARAKKIGGQVLFEIW